MDLQKRLAAHAHLLCEIEDPYAELTALQHCMEEVEDSGVMRCELNLDNRGQPCIWVYWGKISPSMGKIQICSRSLFS